MDLIEQSPYQLPCDNKFCYLSRKASKDVNKHFVRCGVGLWWGATCYVEVLPQLNHSNFCPGFNVPGDLMAEARVGCWRDVYDGHTSCPGGNRERHVFYWRIHDNSNAFGGQSMNNYFDTCQTMPNMFALCFIIRDCFKFHMNSLELSARTLPNLERKTLRNY